MKTFMIVLIIITLIIWHVLIPLSNYLVSIDLLLEKNPPKMVCGRLSDRVIELSDEYLYFWPEYEGKSSWEPGFIDNEKGCDANLVSLNAEILWPSMEPSYTLELGPASTPGYVSIGLKTRQGFESGLAWRLNYLLDRGQVPEHRRNDFDESLGLYYVKHVAIPGTENSHDVYWARGPKGVPTLIECSRLVGIGIYSCSHSWFFGERQPFITLNYAPELLPSWPQLEADIEEFINVHTKK